MVKVNSNYAQAGYGVVLEGADEALKAIKALAPDLDKDLKEKLGGVGKRIASDAKTRVPSQSPLSGWEYVAKDPAGWAAKRNKRPSRGGKGWPAYDAGKIRTGIKSSTSAGKPKGAKFGALVYVSNKDAAGAIFELAGRKSKGAPGTAGANFIKVLEDFDRASRVIWDAYDDMGRNKVQAEVIKAVEDAERELERRFGEGGYTEVTR